MVGVMVLHARITLPKSTYLRTLVYINTFAHVISFIFVQPSREISYPI